MSLYPQHIPLQGALNFRDFGGYATQQGRRVISDFFYRSDKLSELTDTDQQTLAPCGIGHIYDLRRPDEVAQAPSNWQASPAITHHYSIIPPQMDKQGLLQAFEELRHLDEPGVALMELIYRDIGRGDYSHSYFAQLFERLLDDPTTPILVHCSGGKDRTGSTCALILWVLGCDRDTIRDDYMLSKPLYCDNVDPLHMAMQLAQIETTQHIQPHWVTPIMEVRESYLQAMFEGLAERFATPHAFLTEGLGLPADSVDKMRQHYTRKA